MNKNSYEVIGVMSGTSLDGVDLALCSFTKIEQWEFSISIAETIPYSPEWKNRLKEGIHLSGNSLHKLNQDYTALLANTICSFIEKHAILNFDAICSHGHTIHHQPDQSYTLQIGNLPVIADLIGQQVICDFRVQDVGLEGQGAPLVPIGDQLLFSDYEYCLNLGGFANISSEENGTRTAYDICPLNIVLNHFVSKLGLQYDDKGKLASEGKVDEELLMRLNELDFYQLQATKSLGYEWVLNTIIPLIDSAAIKTEDILRTFIEHVAVQISEVISGKQSKMLVTGGGAYNEFLVSRLNDLSEVEIVIPSEEILEYKEALIFGFLGVLKLRSEINVLSSVTGAIKDHSSGKIYQPK
ncbi:MAG: anhydro-N-acetylmuramic acid kinase [Flavobacteriaceae bacterium]|nr:anhydro-N-acetylmuramic acid kinase [Flavobacteriaceae bacterium]